MRPLPSSNGAGSLATGGQGGGGRCVCGDYSPQIVRPIAPQYGSWNGFWINFATLADGDDAFLCKDDYSGTNTYAGIIMSVYLGVGIGVRKIVSGTGFGASLKYPAGNFSIGNWYNITATRIANVLRLYVNGVLRGTTTEESPLNVDTATDLYIGMLNPTSGQYFSGKIAVVKIYNTGLSGAQVVTDFNEHAVRFGLPTI